MAVTCCAQVCHHTLKSFGHQVLKKIVWCTSYFFGGEKESNDFVRHNMREAIITICAKDIANCTNCKLKSTNKTALGHILNPAMKSLTCASYSIRERMSLFWSASKRIYEDTLSSVATWGNGYCIRKTLLLQNTQKEHGERPRHTQAVQHGQRELTDHQMMWCGRGASQWNDRAHQEIVLCNKKINNTKCIAWNLCWQKFPGLL